MDAVSGVDRRVAEVWLAEAGAEQSATHNIRTHVTVSETALPAGHGPIGTSQKSAEESQRSFAVQKLRCFSSAPLSATKSQQLIWR
jgi:hypothetical protein